MAAPTVRAMVPAAARESLDELFNLVVEMTHEADKDAQSRASALVEMQAWAQETGVWANLPAALTAKIEEFGHGKS